ncbi:spore protease YyaC [Metabacillus fastidiosus]|uniref:spore protease YyaC n=1 Tax=Metabacillus fastidiosus TaxID=1458 RepID=UPI002DBBCF82|nr:spore protease YyaC [Metabacillus fastidiosus]MEC2075612.1 spore protease YyaC [Metabacillus fastidiosus]
MNLKSGLFQADKDRNRIYYDEENAPKILSSSLYELLPRIMTKPIVIVCIGTDRSTGDSLGPIIGTTIKKQLSHFNVFGTLKDPVHAVNLEDTMQTIKNEFSNPFIIAIDACLGKIKSVGYIQVGKGPIKPGAGVNKVLPAVGNIHITGIVNVSGFMEYFVLQNTRLHLVMDMAHIIAEGIIEAEKSYLHKRNSLKANWMDKMDNTF